MKKEVETVRFNEIPSTNEYVKTRIAERKDIIAIAKKQSAGKGTKGRSFSSNEGGVYLTKLVFHEDFPAKDAFLIMARTAVAVCKTLEEFSISPVIKWANDVFVNGRKICGILIENVFSGNQISSSVIGVGLNVNNPLPTELKEIATTMREELGKSLDVERVEAILIDRLSKVFEMDEYLKRIGFLGQTVNVTVGEELVPATPVCVERDGGLVLEINGERKKVYAGEVTLRV